MWAGRQESSPVCDMLKHAACTLGQGHTKTKWPVGVSDPFSCGMWQQRVLRGKSNSIATTTDHRFMSTIDCELTRSERDLYFKLIIYITIPL